MVETTSNSTTKTTQGGNMLTNWTATVMAWFAMINWPVAGAIVLTATAIIGGFVLLARLTRKLFLPKEVFAKQ